MMKMSNETHPQQCARSKLTRNFFLLALLMAALNGCQAFDASASSGNVPVPGEAASGNDISATTSLPLGDVNVVVVTDVHSWVAGHNTAHEPFLDVDYGTVLSFYETLQHLVYSQGQHQELIFVNNGDIMDGTGLGLQVERLFPILERMPFSALNLGNHELYFDDNLKAMRDKGFLEHWQQGGGKYLSSNTIWTDTQLPIGRRFTYISTTQHAAGQAKNILVFGFLYDFTEPCASATVERVEDVVQQEWFINALTVNNNKTAVDAELVPDSSNVTTTATNATAFLQQKSVEYQHYEAVLVLAHMDHADPLIHVIRNAIRNITGNDDLPIQFIAGHSHVRGYSVLDRMSTSFEAGRFLDTLGFVSFPWKPTTNATLLAAAAQKAAEEEEDDEYFLEPAMMRASRLVAQKAKNQTTAQSQPNIVHGDPQFRHVYLNANKKALQDALLGNGNNAAAKNSTMETGRGRALTHFIQGTQLSMGLLDVIGCSGGHYRLNLEMDHPRSLWGLYVREVIPHALENNHSRLFLQRTHALRYDMLVGQVTVDDAIAVSPIRDEMVLVLPEVERDDLLLLFNQLNVSAPNPQLPHLPQYAISPWPSPIHGAHRHLHTFELYAMRRDWPHLQRALAALAADESIPSFSTWDLDTEDSDLPRVYKKRTGRRGVQTSHGVWIDFIKDNWICVAPVTGVYTRFREWFVWVIVVITLIGIVHYHSWINGGSSRSRGSRGNYRSTPTTTYMRMAGVTVPTRHQHYARHQQQHREYKQQFYYGTAGYQDNLSENNGYSNNRRNSNKATEGTPMMMNSRGSPTYQSAE